jgi:eukaryotic-like serine/threonine-protein kinase
MSLDFDGGSMTGRLAWLAQYGVVILLAPALGIFLSTLQPFKEIPLGGSGLTAAHAARFGGYAAALAYVWLFADRLTKEIADDGAGLTFLHAVARPFAVVIILLLGDKVLLPLASPLLGKSGHTFYALVFITASVGAALWLTTVWVGRFGALVKFCQGCHRGQPEPERRPARSTPSASERPAIAAMEAERTRILHRHSTATASSFGRYRIIKELGRGSMGIVYLGKDPTIHRFVALKTMRLDHGEELNEKDVKDRFFREAESTGRLSHPNIVTIYDAGEEHETGYIAMEVVEGITLKDWCRKETLLPLARVSDIVVAVADALDYAHRQNVVHRDIKPTNIMVTKDNSIKVMDFGIARMTSSTKTQTSSILGTPSYMSPEQLNGVTVDGRSDIFSLGVVFFELLTGRKPFEAENLSALLFKIAHEPHGPVRGIRPDLPACADEILDRALHKDFRQRYARAKEFGEDVRRCLASSPGSPCN